MTKDSDFVLLLDKLGAPPQVIWVTCGNTSNARLKEVLNEHAAQGARSTQLRREVGRDKCNLIVNRVALASLPKPRNQRHRC